MLFLHMGQSCSNQVPLSPRSHLKELQDCQSKLIKLVVLQLKLVIEKNVSQMILSNDGRSLYYWHRTTKEMNKLSRDDYNLVVSQLESDYGLKISQFVYHEDCNGFYERCDWYEFNYDVDTSRQK